jgi:hypothetical protein
MPRNHFSGKHVAPGCKKPGMDPKTMAGVNLLAAQSFPEAFCCTKASKRG